MNAPDYSHVVGHQFPGGTYTLPGYESWLWADAVEGDPHQLVPPNELAYMIGLHGAGASIGEIMGLLGSSPDSGVLMGELEFELSRPLESDATYDVSGHIASVERKQGRQAGTFDLVEFIHELRTQGEEKPCARIRHYWIFPRKETG